jgi:hypothetical protein
LPVGGWSPDQSQLLFTAKDNPFKVDNKIEDFSCIIKDKSPSKSFLKEVNCEPRRE